MLALLLSGRAIIDEVKLLLLISGLAGMCLLLFACGGSPAGHVAQLGTTSEGGSSSKTSASSTPVSGVVAFSHCMRSHGIPSYPDPGSGGVIPKKSPQQLGVSPSEFQVAQGACIHLVPNVGAPTPAQVQQYRSVMLIYAHCMRKHGVSNMPDPDSRGRLDIGPGTDVVVNGPKFQAAFRVCKSKLSP